jgi:hypothetical protein
MIKNLSALEIKIGERVYKLICEIDSPLGEVHDCLCQMKQHVIQRINEIQKAEQTPVISPDEVA